MDAQGGRAVSALWLSPTQPSSQPYEEGEPPAEPQPELPATEKAAIALGCWMLVFEALGVVKEAETMPANHFLHSVRVSSQIEGWAKMVAQVRDALARSNVNRQTLLHAQYDTREGRRHLLQQAVMRTAKHAHLNPGDWEPFSKALMDWLGPDRVVLEKRLLPSSSILLPEVSSPNMLSPSMAFTPAARSTQPPLTPRNLTADETLRMDTSALQAEVLSLREYKLKREAADKAEDSVIVMHGLRNKLTAMQKQQALLPAERRQQLDQAEDRWRREHAAATVAAREALIASHAVGRNRQTDEQNELFRHMDEYVDKIAAHLPDGQLEVEVKSHNALVATLHERREAMKAEHTAARENLAKVQHEEVTQMQRDNEAVILC